MDKLEFLRKLHNLGVRFSVEIVTGNGGTDVPATPEDLILVEDDQVAGYAQVLGVSRSDYLGWVGDNYNLVCGGITAKGRRCKNIIEGGHVVSAKYWADRSGEYCHLHGGY